MDAQTFFEINMQQAIEDEARELLKDQAFTGECASPVKTVRAKPALSKQSSTIVRAAQNEANQIILSQMLI